MKTVIKALAVAASLLMPAAAFAQDYPSQTVKIIVPSGPGASNDNFARFLADKLSQKWNSSVIVENMPGAGGAIGFGALAQSAPDGHTLVLYSSSFITFSVTQSGLPFDPAKDILPVASWADGQLLMVASDRLGIKSVDDLVRIGKEQTIFSAGTGPASTAAFVSYLVADVLGIKLEMVNYKGGAEALLDIAGDRADIYIGSVTSILPVIEKGDAVPLAVLMPERSSTLPDVPTIVEAGFPNAVSGLWFGIHAPAGTPDAVVEKINGAVNEVLALDETRVLLEKGGASPAPMSAADFQAFVKSEMDRFRALAEKFNIKV